MRTILLLAALAAAGPALAAAEPGIIPSPSQPPATPAFRQCITPEMAQRHFATSLARAGNPPAITVFSVLPDGRGVVSLLIMGNPQVFNLVFAGHCLAGSFVTPAP